MQVSLTLLHQCWKSTWAVCSCLVSRSHARWHLPPLAKQPTPSLLLLSENLYYCSRLFISCLTWYPTQPQAYIWQSQSLILLLYSLHPFYFQYSLKKRLQRFRSKLCKRTAQRQKFFIWLNTLCQKLTVPEQGIGRDRRRYILCRFFIRDMDDLERDTISPCALFWFTNVLQMWYTLMSYSYSTPMQLITTGVLKIMGE